jgi:predicted AlkP superfamily phosphohydrolase/phosphomutase
VVHVERGADGSISTRVVGPRQARERTDAQVGITLAPTGDGLGLMLKSGGEPSELRLEMGRWSDWLRVKVPTGAFQSVRGVVRFYLRAIEPELQLLASPVNFDPLSPPFPISSPVEYSAELARRLGTYYTTGMVEDHGALSNDRIDEWAFLAQCGEVWDEREAMLLLELEREKDGLIYCLFDTTDRVQHMLWRHLEPSHPANRGRPADPALARSLMDQYRRADAALEAIRAAIGDDPRTLLIVLSDHGFGSFQRGVQLNTWLHNHGLLSLKPGIEAGENAPDLLRAIDWSRTKAYALGLGGIYFNMNGRESNGIVEADECERLGAEIARGLCAIDDEERGARPIRGVSTARELYSGPYVGEAPDLFVRFEAGYRVSWSTSLGGVSGGAVIEDNTKAWAGDHVVDSALVPGVLFADRPMSLEGARLIDLAPTIVEALGVPRGAAFEGRSLWRAHPESS